MFIAVLREDVADIQADGIRAEPDHIYISASETKEEAIEKFLSWQPSLTYGDVAVFQVTKHQFRSKQLKLGGLHIYATNLPLSCVKLISERTEVKREHGVGQFRGNATDSGNLSIHVTSFQQTLSHTTEVASLREQIAQLKAQVDAKFSHINDLLVLSAKANQALILKDAKIQNHYIL